jgi:hypothetical protein
LIKKKKHSAKKAIQFPHSIQVSHFNPMGNKTLNFAYKLKLKKSVKGGKKFKQPLPQQPSNPRKNFKHQPQNNNLKP